MANIELQLGRVPSPDNGSNVVGSIRIDGADRSCFVGWVELLSLLEQCLDDHVDHDRATNDHQGGPT